MVAHRDTLPVWVLCQACWIRRKPMCELVCLLLQAICQAHQTIVRPYGLRKQPANLAPARTILVECENTTPPNHLACDRKDRPIGVYGTLLVEHLLGNIR